MNNYYTLIYLNNELNGNILGGKFQSAISPHKNVLECYIETVEETHRLVFSVKAAEIALFLDEYRPPKKQNVVEFFSTLKGQEIIHLSLAENDRLLSIDFKNEMRLLFKLFGNSANAYLISQRKIVDTFKNPDDTKGKPPPEPQAPNFAENITGNAKPKNELTKLNPLLPRNLLAPLIKEHGVDEMSVPETKAFTKNVTEALLNNPHPRVLNNGGLTLWPEALLPLETEKSFATVNEAIRFAYRNAVHLRRLHHKRERLSQFLERSVSKKKAQHRQLQQVEKSLERADEYEKFGHLLMANAHKSVKPGARVIETDDFYEENTLIIIPLKEGLNIVENAERYYDKAKSSRTSYKKARQRTPKVKREKEQAERLLDELRGFDRLYNLERWIKNNAETLEKFGYGTEDEGQAESPFRKFKVGKYEVWIGKNAKSNDKLTAHAHKEDIWLHARGVAGSHTVIRMGNESSYPPKEVILHAASYAAWYSKAKGMQSAPVMYTKRKYVYKASGAAPGAVVVKREEVAMVPPTRPG